MESVIESEAIGEESFEEKIVTFLKNQKHVLKNRKK